MAPMKDSFLDLERHRQKLEENVNKLSKALDHWKQWKEEYEELRRNVESLPPSAGKEERRRTREKFEGDLLDEKELANLFGPDDSKKTEQIVSTLTNRLEYVTKNVNTLSKQLEDAENRLAAVTVVTNPEPTDEGGFPITEIREELDEDDNVISYSLRKPGDNRPQIIETLRKAGITGFEPTTNGDQLSEASDDTHDVDMDSSKDVPSPLAERPKESQDEGSPMDLDPPSQQPEEPQVEEQPKAKPAAKKKSVKFSEDTKPDEPQEKSDTAKRLEEILQMARDQQSIISDPIMPADESPDDMALREDMIRYNKDTMEYEMAPIVAELQLEEGSTEDSDDYSDFEEDEHEEDEWGRTKIEVDDDWKLRMLELKERLRNHEFKMKQPPDDDDDMFEGIGRISIRREGQDALNGDAESEPALKPETPVQDTKKSVRFAQSLDIAEDTSPAPAQAPKQPKHPEVDPVSEVVLERNGGTPKPVTTPSSKKASRFRKARSNEPPIIKAPRALDGTPIAPDKPDISERPIPSGPEGKTLAGSVLEHEPSLETKEPDEFDANLLQKQATEEYYKLRNKLVYRQGGFMKEDENPIQPLDEEEGGPKRMSRFKAARLAKP
ncbi:Prefoldin subunit-domain-containing protein [Hypoxylon sp. FL0890]|nr:Prefoldin subunit-domain-containing protein [Hypoxylon sp. FL0890]